MAENKPLPPILAGPIVRRFTPNEMVIWLVSSASFEMSLEVKCDKTSFIVKPEETNNWQTFALGESAHIQVITAKFPEKLVNNSQVFYDLCIKQNEQVSNLKDLIPDLLYDGEASPSVVLKTEVVDLLHGSCRKPHHTSGDSLLRIDAFLEKNHRKISKRPALLMMSGDQIYADDVSGPMLVAIHQSMTRLNLFTETFDGAIVNDTESLLNHPFCYYQRTNLLPDDDANEALQKRFFKGKRKPIFTSVHAQNHLITASEVFAMYLLTWSPELWRLVDWTSHNVESQFLPLFEKEKEPVQKFASGLDKVRRMMAHIPVYMIFDDHDVTDDWNLTRAWEEAAYNNPFSKRIIGNALFGYWLFQGIGNQPAVFKDLVDKGNSLLQPQLPGLDSFITDLLKFNQWHFSLDTDPKLIVLDTRTNRWRSEEKIHNPSGLMDYESLQALKEEMLGHDNIILVSAAPIFGVKAIEAIQKMFAFFGKALMVDAENWMAHQGTAKVILDIFQQKNGPKDVVILSGDVHYSFVYDVRLRFKSHHPYIHQITCSGIKNEFPASLLRFFDKWNRILYGRTSPLNWFTKRRKMSIRTRRPNKHKTWSLVNKSAIGLIHIDKKTGHPTAKLLCHDGEDIKFY